MRGRDGCRSRTPLAQKSPEHPARMSLSTRGDSLCLTLRPRTTSTTTRIAAHRASAQGAAQAHGAAVRGQIHEQRAIRCRGGGTGERFRADKSLQGGQSQARIRYGVLGKKAAGAPASRTAPRQRPRYRRAGPQPSRAPVPGSCRPQCRGSRRCVWQPG